MAVILEKFLTEYENGCNITLKNQNVLKQIREELYKKRSNKSKDIPNDTVSKQILSGRWDYPDGSCPLSKRYRDYCRNHTDFIGNGSMPL